MKFHYLLPAVLLVGCAEPAPPQDTGDQSSSGVEDHGGGEETPAREIIVSPQITFPSCEAPLAAFEVSVRYADDQSFVPNYSCLWKFDDGTTLASCNGEHVFAEPGFHDFILEVTDLDTGATAEVAQRRHVEGPIVADLQLSADDLSLTWNATVNVGAEVHVFVQPEDAFIIDDPAYHQNRSYTIEARRAGTYTVVMTVEDERAIPICTERIEKQITLVCDGDGHVH